MVKLTIICFIVFSLISIFYTTFTSMNLDTVSLSSFLYSIGKLAGLIGFLFLSLLIFSGETARFLDIFFGMDKIIKFQRKFALITSIFVLFHPIFFILSSKSLLPFIVPNLTVIPLAFGIISFYVFTIIMLASVIYKRISYRIWQYIHILTYLLFFFSLYHAIILGSDYKFLSIKIIYWILLISIIIGITYRIYYKIKQRNSKFIVKEVKWETKETFTLIIEPKQKFSFKAGQFCFLRLNKEKLYARHPFTISSSPKEKDLHFTIKLQGRFTKEASILKEGEEVIVEGPFGIFTVENSRKDLVFIAGGVGITPFMSVIKDHLHKNRTQNILLLYGSRTEERIIFKNELDSIDKEWFKKIYVISGDESVFGIYERCYIDKSMIKKHVKDIESTLFYICGPEAMKKCVNKALAELEVQKLKVFIEDFFW